MLIRIEGYLKQLRMGYLKRKLNRMKGVCIRGKISIGKHSQINVISGGELVIGKNFYMNSFSTINCRHSIMIGENVLIGENVHVYDHNHRFTDKEKPINAQGFKTKKVMIGDNTWIGTGVTILPGTEIGNNCVIGANCLVYGTIPENSVVRLSQKTEIVAK